MLGAVWPAVNLVIAVAAAGLAGPGDSARAIVRTALRAVEGDSATRVAAPWTAHRTATPHDRASALGLASLARLTYRYTDAEHRYQTLIDSTAPDAYSTYARLGLGWTFDAHGLTIRADSAFSHARVEAHQRHDALAEAEALIALSLNRASRLGVPLGLALLDTASHLTPPDALDLRAAIGVRRAILFAVLSRPTAAAEATAAADLARRAHEPRLVALALRALALDLKIRGATDSAGVVLTDVERIERATHDDVALGTTLMRHGDLFHAAGDVGSFKRYALAARETAERAGDLYVLGASHIALASISLLLNDYASARDPLTRAEQIYDEEEDSSGVFMARGYEAVLALAVGDLARARAFDAQVLAFHRRIGDTESEFEVLRELTAIALRAGDLQAAAATIDTAAALARTQHQPSWIGGLETERGRLALARGDTRSAIRWLAQHARGMDTSDHILRYAARSLLAEAYARDGQLTVAEHELSAASDELDTWRATLTDRALRPFVFQLSSREANDRDASIAVVVAALAAGGRADAAFTLAERRRGRELADRLVVLAALQEGAVASGAAGPTAPSASHLIADSVVAAFPDPHTALLEYVTGARGAPTTLFVITRGPRTDGSGHASVHAHLLSSGDSLAVTIGRFVTVLEAGADAGAVARALGATILKPAVADVGPEVTHLVIVPDGPLHRLPFDALYGADGRPIVERFAVSLAPSASVARALWQRPPARGRAADLRLLAFGDPAFEHPAPTAGGHDDTVLRGETVASADVYRSAFDSAGGLPRLTESGREARTVARYASRAEVRLGVAASAAYLRHTPLDRFRVIHFATHALVDERTPTRTALALAPGDGETGFVTPSELAALHLGADLVVLSACRSAGGVVVDGEGVQGLTAPLLAAGARAVVATEWRIGDRATVPFVDAMYGAVARGESVGDALRAAKLAAITRGAPVSEWAAFTVVGDPFVHVPLQTPRGPAGRRWLAIVLIVIGGAALVSYGTYRLRLPQRTRVRA